LLNEFRGQWTGAFVGRHRQRGLTQVVDDSWNAFRAAVQHVDCTIIENLVYVAASGTDAVAQVSLDFLCSKRFYALAQTRALP
jgi:hypothetical protein